MGQDSGSFDITLESCDSIERKSFVEGGMTPRATTASSKVLRVFAYRRDEHSKRNETKKDL